MSRFLKRYLCCCRCHESEVQIATNGRSSLQEPDPRTDNISREDLLARRQAEQEAKYHEERALLLGRRCTKKTYM